MSRFRVFRKLGAGQRGVVEKCPICSEGWVDFMDINGDGSLLGCYKCGAVFVSKSLRDSELQGKKEQIERQLKPEYLKEPVKDRVPDAVKALNDAFLETLKDDIGQTDDVKFICPTCQKECKNQVGLMAHMRSHKA